MAGKTKMEAAQLAEGALTDEALMDWEKRIGLELRVGNIFNQTVSYEAIRNFSNGTGDANPLYWDPGYAGKTRYEALIASPSWV
ncbi:MAG: acyl dehydratase, partial [Chloroflexi bacterium CG_4_9_14_3_um_filter_45_9]